MGIGALPWGGRARAVFLCGAQLLAGCTLAPGDDDGSNAQAEEVAVTVDAAGGTSADSFSRIPEIVREVEPSVVAVVTDAGEGSGVVWGSDGTIVTNSHVIAGASRIEIGFADGQRAPARVVATDPLVDLAVLISERTDLPTATFADELPVVGELAIAMGNPLGFENTVTAGIVSGLYRSIPGSALTTQSLVDLIQTDAPISPGNSGGALVDGDGEVIGINVAYIPPQARAVSIGFAIPSPTVIDVVNQLIEDGTAEHSYFGVVPAALTPQIASRLGANVETGVVVLEVVPDGPAEAAGIQAGDVITSLDGDSLATVEEFLSKLRRHEPGDELTTAFTRGEEELVRTVTLADRPPAGG